MISQQFDSLLSELKDLYKLIQKQSQQQPLDIMQINQHGVTHQHILEKWSSLKSTTQTTSLEPEIQSFYEQINPLSELIRITLVKATYFLNNEPYDYYSDITDENEDEEDEFQFQFYATGKKLLEKEFQSSKENILCLMVFVE